MAECVLSLFSFIRSAHDCILVTCLWIQKQIGILVAFTTWTPIFREQLQLVPLKINDKTKVTEKQ